MTKPRATMPTRWRDGPRGSATPEDRAATLMQIALPPCEPDTAVLARVGRRLLGERRQPLRSHLAFRVAMVALAILAGGASVKAYEWVRQVAWPEQRVAPPAQSDRPRARAMPRRRRTEAAPVTAAQPPMLDEDRSAAQGSPPPPRAVAPSRSVASPKPTTHAGKVGPEPSSHPPAMAPPAAPESALEPGGAAAVAAPGWQPSAPVPAPATDEITALDHAMALLRREHNAEAALAELDAYLRRYPNGFLHREALSGRVDALLLLRRTEQALAALEAFPFDNRRRSLELQVIRGELRARRDCAIAITDFDDALRRGPDAALLERILHGRGACRAKIGDLHGAAWDFRRYVERFPEGSHAAWTFRWLESHDPSIRQQR